MASTVMAEVASEGALRRRWRTGRDWVVGNFQWRGLWRMYAACFVFQAAQNTAKPFFLAAAMSVVRCSAPLKLGQSTGSAYCGDKAFVIQEAQRIVALGHTISGTVAAVMALVHTIAVDCIHRKNMLLFVFLSPAVVYACQLPFLCEFLGSWSVLFWYFGSFVEGLSPKTVRVVATVWLDATEGDDQRRADMVILRRMVSGLSFGVSKPLALLALRAELLDFRLAFLGLAVLMSAGCMLVLRLELPRLVARTRMNLRACVRMLTSVAQLCWQNHTVFWTVFCEALHMAVIDCESFQLQTFSLAVFHWRQGTLMMTSLATGVFVMTPLLPLALYCLRRFGERRVYYLASAAMALASLVCKLLLPSSPAFLVLAAILTQMRQRALESITEAARARMPHNHASVRGRSSALLSVSSNLLSAGFTALLAKVFDASARSYSGKLRPFLILAVLEMVLACVFVVKVWPAFSKILDAISKDRLARASASGPPGRPGPGLTPGCGAGGKEAARDEPG